MCFFKITSDKIWACVFLPQSVLKSELPITFYIFKNPPDRAKAMCPMMEAFVEILF